MAGRKRRIRAPLRHRHNFSRDKIKLLTAFYLFNKERGKGATPNELAKAIPRTQASDIFKEYLEEMLEMKWVNSTEAGGGMSIFNITEKGREAVAEVKSLVDKKHPLSQLDIFQVED